ncbi:MAG: mannonate dehydratase [Spirochaetales bacterium]|nr:mannonate dehydratase [Spirochaetales bacterium]
MRMTFRWFGPSDPITLQHIRQIPGVEGIVSSAFDIPSDEVIPAEAVLELKAMIEKQSMTLDCFESIPVHDNIKLGTDDRDRYIDIWLESLRNVASAGVRTVCYNFMLAFDWLRTDLSMRLEDGSKAMQYQDAEVAKMDMTGDIPAWSQKYTPETLAEMLKKSRAVSVEQLWANLEYFLKRVVPVAEELGVKLAIHPDDPPWPVLGINRIITSMENLERFVKLVDSPNNGLALCSGSLGANPENDIPAMIRRFGGLGRINFMHVRNLKHTGEKEFHETAHYSPCGNLDMYEIMKSIHDTGFTGPLRPDHGRDVWGEVRTPGYGLYDRAMGVNYILGLWEAITKASL